MPLNGPVAQLVRAPPCHGGGREFESHLGRFSLSIRGLSSAGRASALQAEGHRFEPCRPHLFLEVCNNADVAQLAEQLICNQQVIGSSPIIGLHRINGCGSDGKIWVGSRAAKGGRL